MASIEAIQGLWKPISHEQDGIRWTAEESSRCAFLILLPEPLVPGSVGIWSEAKYHQQPTATAVAESIMSMKRLVGGLRYERSSDFHLYSGGFVRLGEAGEGIGTIDLVVYHGPHCSAPGPELSTSLGLLRYDGTHLAVCLAEAGTPERPSAFTSGHSVTVYVRQSPAA